MDNFLNPYDKEYMRLAIIKHEETFKQQVHELHRLYRIQKLLMRNIRQESPKIQQNQELWNSNNNTIFAEKKPDSERPADQDFPANLIEESEIELTLGPSNYCSRRRKKNSKKTDTPLTSDSGPSFSSSSTGSSHNRNTSNGNNQLSLFQVPDKANYQNGNNDHNVDDKFRQERLNQPAWLFQVLSLNMT